MTETIVNLFFLCSRYVHIVCTTLIVGGTLFYEMVVPIAIADLKDEHQLAVFGRARWTFRQVVWGCAIALIASGIIESRQHWMDYSRPEVITIEVGPNGQLIRQPPPTIQRPR